MRYIISKSVRNRRAWIFFHEKEETVGERAINFGILDSFSREITTIRGGDRIVISAVDSLRRFFPIPEESRGISPSRGAVKLRNFSSGRLTSPAHSRETRVRLSHGSCFVVPVFKLHRLSKVEALRGDSSRKRSKMGVDGELLLLLRY